MAASKYKRIDNPDVGKNYKPVVSTPVQPAPAAPVTIQLINPQPQSQNIPNQAAQQSVAPTIPLINPQPQSRNTPTVRPAQQQSINPTPTGTTGAPQPTSTATQPVMQPGFNPAPQSINPSTISPDPLTGVENRPGYYPEPQSQQPGQFQYQYDFFTKEGQAERLKNALETASFRTSPTSIGGQYIHGVSETATAAIDAVNILNILNAGQSVFKAIAGMGKIGQLALSAGGAQTIAATIPEAAGIAPTIAAVGAPAVNTVTTAAKVGFIANLFKMQGMGKVIGLGAVVSAMSGATSTRKDISDYIKDSGALIMKLREEGMSEMADELAESNKDLRDGFDLYLPYIPVIGANLEKNKIQGYRDKLNDNLNTYDAKVRADKEKQAADKLAADQAATIAKMTADTAKTESDRINDQKVKDEQRAYDEQKAEKERKQKQQDLVDSRRYNEQQQTETRSYNEQQTTAAAQREFDQSAIATEAAGSSTLNFGLLSSGGSVEFVDRDKAATVYFGKPYVELTAAQKRLLDLSKGG